MAQPYNQSVFLVEIEKIRPNPYQPRREFDLAPLQELADSIRQYGILQPLVVTRVEETTDTGLQTFYELIAGERRLRASKLAGLREVPALIRTDEIDPRAKLELAIIENIQREDLNALERGRAFKRLVDEFAFTHTQIGKKVGKSREYVSNSVRLLFLPQEMLDALVEKKINEGHTRPLLMLSDKPEEQKTLFKDIILHKLNVRDAERIARHHAAERARRVTTELEPEVLQIEQQLMDNLGTRVQIERHQHGGRVTIEFISIEDLRGILDRFERKMEEQKEGIIAEDTDAVLISEPLVSANPREKEQEELYSVSNFSI
jgi:ParB family chromosome partitioning protein